MLLFQGRIKMYRFYGHENVSDETLSIYDRLSHIWAADTCAPRMRDRWTKDDPTLGQCSITAFLVQDILGGRVYGIELPDGNYHCFNVVDGVVFDLTSEQFDQTLDYEDCVEQFREDHFRKQEKKERYLLLKERYEREVI